MASILLSATVASPTQVLDKDPTLPATLASGLCFVVPSRIPTTHPLGMAATINPVQSTDSSASTSSSSRAKSPLRQNGFAVTHLPSSSASTPYGHNSGMTANGDHNPTVQYLSRSRTTTGSSTITLKPQSHTRPAAHTTGTMGRGGSADSDGDVEMEEGGPSGGADQVSRHT